MKLPQLPSSTRITTARPFSSSSVPPGDESRIATVIADDGDLEGQVSSDRR